jgi:hypothetical protein
MEDWYTCFIQGQANQTAEKPWQGWIVKFSNNGTVARFERASYGSSSQQRAKDKLLKSIKDNMKSLCNEINDYMESVARSKRSLDAINNLTPEAEPASEPASPAPARY